MKKSGFRSAGGSRQVPTPVKSSVSRTSNQGYQTARASPSSFASPSAATSSTTTNTTSTPTTKYTPNERPSPSTTASPIVTEKPVLQPQLSSPEIIGQSKRKRRKGELVFQANFESGNLGKVKAIKPESEYELYIRPDTNNPSYRLWFYFSVDNCKKNQRVLFSIVNFSKARSLYRQGMTPLVRSEQRPHWERIPEKQVYYYRHPKTKNYVLSYLFVFDRENDVYYFSYCYPYTYVCVCGESGTLTLACRYSDLQQFLFNVDSRGFDYFNRQLLARTVQNRRLDLITISEPTPLTPQGTKKKMIFITSRVHPGETPSSFMIHGLVSFLVSNHPDAKLLRENLIFKIVPMLNPDGVYLGNYRCSSMGNDLNRFWLNPERWAHPTIVATRGLLLRLKEDPDVDLDFFIDMHSHSAASNGFMFVNQMDDPQKKEDQLLYPRLLDMKAKEFSFSDTRYCKDASKLGTGRRALGEMLQVAPHCYTLEVSFFSFTQDMTKHVPFTQENYLSLGVNVALTFIDYYKLAGRRRYKTIS